MVVTPASLPDEFVRGYRGRVLRLNGWRQDRRDELCMLEQFIGKKVSSHDIPMGELLACMAQVNLEHFARSHSMYPLQRAIANEVGGGLLGVGGHRKLAMDQLFWVPRPRAYLCRACIEEDLAFHGISYWRREHQISGQYQSNKHRLPLMSVETRLHHAFHESPAWVLPEATPVPTQMLARQISSPAIDRYLEICSHLLVGTMVLSKEAVSQVASRRANQLGIEVDERHVLRSLLWSPEIQGCIDTRWLESTFSESFNVSGHRRTESAGGVWHSTFVSALVFGALYQTADEAINAMTRVSHAESRVANLVSQSSPS